MGGDAWAVGTLTWVSLTSCVALLIWLAPWKEQAYGPQFFFRSAWVNVMPEWLLSVISGILAGGSPVSALSFVASFTLLLGPSVLFDLSLFCLIFGGHTQDDTQDVIVQLISQSW